MQEIISSENEEYEITEKKKMLKGKFQVIQEISDNEESDDEGKSKLKRKTTKNINSKPKMESNEESSQNNNVYSPQKSIKDFKDESPLTKHAIEVNNNLKALNFDKDFDEFLGEFNFKINSTKKDSPKNGNIKN